jgi:hypothetical protein
MERLLQETKDCSWWKGERIIQKCHWEEIGITGLHVQAAAAVLQASAGVSTQQHTLRPRNSLKPETAFLP